MLLRKSAGVPAEFHAGRNQDLTVILGSGLVQDLLSLELMPGKLWNIVLAAGRGARLASVTGGVPKQFWSRDGSPTLLEETLRRTAALVPPGRTVIVVDDTHRPFVDSLPELDPFEHVVYQPADRGTAAGVLLGLTRVMTADRDAVILLTPSDHGVRSSATFAAGIRRAVRDVRIGKRGVVLFGVAPKAAEADYGWILPASGVRDGGFQQVASFKEKPAPDVARELFASGAVWNTMVLAARASALLALFAKHLPLLTGVFLEAMDRGIDEGMPFLRAQYKDLPPADFSRDLIGETDALSLHTWPVSMGWTDLGTPDRLADWLLGNQPASAAVARSRAAAPDALVF